MTSEFILIDIESQNVNQNMSYNNYEKYEQNEKIHNIVKDLSDFPDYILDLNSSLNSLEKQIMNPTKYSLFTPIIVVNILMYLVSLLLSVFHPVQLLVSGISLLYMYDVHRDYNNSHLPVIYDIRYLIHKMNLSYNSISVLINKFKQYKYDDELINTAYILCDHLGKIYHWN
jgi:hypothetical protein